MFILCSYIWHTAHIPLTPTPHLLQTQCIATHTHTHTHTHTPYFNLWSCILHQFPPSLQKCTSTPHWIDWFYCYAQATSLLWSNNTSSVLSNDMFISSALKWASCKRVRNAWSATPLDTMIKWYQKENTTFYLWGWNWPSRVDCYMHVKVSAYPVTAAANLHLVILWIKFIKEKWWGTSKQKV